MCCEFLCVFAVSTGLSSLDSGGREKRGSDEVDPGAVWKPPNNEAIPTA